MTQGSTSALYHLSLTLIRAGYITRSRNVSLNTL